MPRVIGGRRLTPSQQKKLEKIHAGIVKAGSAREPWAAAVSAFKKSVGWNPGHGKKKVSLVRPKKRGMY